MILTKFESHIGEHILLVVPRVHPVAYHRVKLVGVEAGGGLWIESDELTNQELTDLIRQTAGPAGATKIPINFLPYSEIAKAVVAENKQA